MKISSEDKSLTATWSSWAGSSWFWSSWALSSWFWAPGSHGIKPLVNEDLSWRPIKEQTHLTTLTHLVMIMIIIMLLMMIMTIIMLMKMMATTMTRVHEKLRILAHPDHIVDWLGVWKTSVKVDQPRLISHNWHCIVLVRKMIKSQLPQLLVPDTLFGNLSPNLSNFLFLLTWWL